MLDKEYFNRVKNFNTYEDYLVDQVILLQKGATGSMFCRKTQILETIFTHLAQFLSTNDLDTVIDYVESKTDQEVYVSWLTPGFLVAYF
jgi:hypothetical protein